MLNTHSQKDNQDPALIGSEAKNPLPIKMHNVMATDMVGLSWIFADETFPSEIFVDVVNDLDNVTANQENCIHFPSLEMPELKNKRECILCKKILD